MRKKDQKKLFNGRPHHLTSSIHLLVCYSANKKISVSSVTLTSVFFLRTGEELQRQPLTGAYEGKISSCSRISELLGESPVLSIYKVDLIVTLVSPCC
jgi:hypothetical protein